MRPLQVGTTWFFSSCDGIVDLRRGIQASSCVGPGKSILPLLDKESASFLIMDLSLQNYQDQLDKQGFWKHNAARE